MKKICVIVSVLVASLGLSAVETASATTPSKAVTSDQSYLVHPEELRSMGFPDEEIQNQEVLFASLNKLEKTEWQRITDQEKEKIRNIPSLRYHEPQALVQCYRIRHEIQGAITNHCGFGEISLGFFVSVTHVSPGQHYGRILYQPKNTTAKYWSRWRKETNSFFEMPFNESSTGTKIYPFAYRVQRTPVGATPYGELR